MGNGAMPRERKKPMPTMKKMCEKIVEAELLICKDGTAPTAKEIFDNSPKGKLYMIFEWYRAAKIVLKNRRKKRAKP